jgi:diguanylate cyclase (GGDEF)-like protein/PAS domain S-box-containing protein
MAWQEKRRLHFEKTFVMAAVLVFCIFVAGAGLIFRLIKNDYDLGQLTDNLKEKIRERTLALEENNRSLRMMSQALEQSPVSVILCNPEGRIIYVNPHFEEVTGYSIDEALGKNPRFLQSGLTSGETYLDMWQSVHAGKVWKGEVCNKRKDGQFFWEHVSLSPIKNDSAGIIGYVAVKEDISQRKLQEEKLLKQANYDSLTGLPNRMLAMDRLNQAILQVQRRGGAVAVLFIDLDNFKHVNDTLGHQGGDLLLKMAARRFVTCLRDCDTAARFGGDEFLLILSELQNGHDAQPILQRIIEAFMQPFTIEGQDFYTTTSVGVSICPENGTLTGELLKTSDIAMYVAKKKGKNTYCFFSDHDDGDGWERTDENA